VREARRIVARMVDHDCQTKLGTKPSEIHTRPVWKMPGHTTDADQGATVDADRDVITMDAGPGGCLQQAVVRAGLITIGIGVGLGIAVAIECL
jgi:hypothetical protein